MAKFDFLPDLHHVYSKVAFLQVMNNYKVRFSKIGLLDPIWFHQRDQIEADMAFMGRLLATILATPLTALKAAKL